VSAPEVAAPYLPAARWSYPDTLAALVAGYIGALVVGGILVAASGREVDEIGGVELFVTLLAQSAGHLAVIGWLSERRGTGSWGEDFGLRVRGRDSWGIAAGVALQLLVAVIVGPLVELLAPEDAPRQGIAEVADRLEGTLSRIVFVVLVVGLAPVVEEIVFRGMLLARLRRAMSPPAAIALSAAAFAVIHYVLDPDALFAVPGLFVIGVALAWLALRSGDLSAAIFVHVGVNLTGALVLILDDELVQAAARIGGPGGG